MIDTDKYEGHTTTHWSARNQGAHNHKHLLYGSFDSCDEDYEHDEPFLETDGGNIAIGYMVGGRHIHPLEEKRANMRLMADAPLLLEEVKRLRDELKQAHHFLRDIRDGLIADSDWVYINEHLGDEEE